MRYRIAPHSSDEGFSASAPGLPGCRSQGTIEADAIENVKVAIEAYLAVVDAKPRVEDVREIEVTI